VSSLGQISAKWTGHYCDTNSSVNVRRHLKNYSV
jgi:hypothetical protein